MLCVCVCVLAAFFVAVQLFFTLCFLACLLASVMVMGAVCCMDNEREGTFLKVTSFVLGFAGGCS